MKTESILYTKNLILRDATENDSEFILKLRTDPKKAKHLSPTSTSLKDQVMYMKSYKTRTDQAYFIIENKNNEMLGCIRMYNPSRDSFEWGSWLIVSGALPFVALESALSMYSYAKRLGFRQAKVDVRQENINVWKFHENMFDAVLIKQDEFNRYYQIDQKMIDLNLERYKSLLYA